MFAFHACVHCCIVSINTHQCTAIFWRAHPRLHNLRGANCSQSDRRQYKHLRDTLGHLWKQFEDPFHKFPFTFVLSHSDILYILQMKIQNFASLLLFDCRFWNSRWSNSQIITRCHVQIQYYLKMLPGSHEAQFGWNCREGPPPNCSRP